MTDTDRELLALAAKAARYRVHGWINDRLYVVDPHDVAERFDPFPWNPRDDDGDALRLAVDLDLTLYTGSGIARGPAPTDVQVWGGINPDCRMVLRIAIVHAAAEIGRKL